MFVQNLLVRSPGASLVSCTLVLLAACGSVSKAPTHAEPVGQATTTPAELVVAPKPIAQLAVTSANSGTTHTNLMGVPAVSSKAHASFTQNHATAPASLFGTSRTWKIDGHVFPGISALDEREATALHGSYVMSYSSLVTPWERCDGPVSTAREATVEEWFASYDARELDDTDRATLQAKAGAKVMVHDLSCKDATQIEIVELSPDHVAIARDGVIFTASRVH